MIPNFGVIVVNLRSMTNNDLYREWTDSMESAALDPSNGYAKRREEQCMNEIVRRMQEASKRPLVRQEV
jgi:hypothetical protein